MREGTKPTLIQSKFITPIKDRVHTTISCLTKSLTQMRGGVNNNHSHKDSITLSTVHPMIHL